MKGLTKKRMLSLLRQWVDQDPELERENYGSSGSYASDAKSIEQAGKHARLLLLLVEWRDDIDAKLLLNAFASTYSGRLSFSQAPGTRRWMVDYCTGQYWPAEYRSAVCYGLVQALYVADRQQNPGLTRRAHHHWAFYNLGGEVARRWFDF